MTCLSDSHQSHHTEYPAHLPVVSAAPDRCSHCSLTGGPSREHGYKHFTPKTQSYGSIIYPINIKCCPLSAGRHFTGTTTSSQSKKPDSPRAIEWGRALCEKQPMRSEARGASWASTQCASKHNHWQLNAPDFPAYKQHIQINGFYGGLKRQRWRFMNWILQLFRTKTRQYI